MKLTELKVAAIGNSRGVRIPAAVLKRYHIGNRVVMEEKVEGILLRPSKTSLDKLSWKDTGQAMAESGEDWADWEGANHDGLKNIPWAAEPRATYTIKKRRSRR